MFFDGVVLTLPELQDVVEYSNFVTQDSVKMPNTGNYSYANS